MKVRNGEVWAAHEHLQALLKEPWPIKTAYWLAKLGRKLNDQYGVIDEMRVRLVRQYGTEDERKQVSISPENPNWVQFVAEMNELMLVEVEIPIEKIVLPSDRPDAPQVHPASLMALDSFVGVA